jgi:hypothetical protein
MQKSMSSSIQDANALHLRVVKIHHIGRASQHHAGSRPAIVYGGNVPD